MPVRLDKPWMTNETALMVLRGQMGVYQLADAHGQILFIGYAGGASLFGLRGEVEQALQRVAGVAGVRVEVTTSYLSRYRELLMAHVADHGALPPQNPPINLGMLSPA